MPDAKTIDISTDAIKDRLRVRNLIYHAYPEGEEDTDTAAMRALVADRDRLATDNARLRKALDPFKGAIDRIEYFEPLSVGTVAWTLFAEGRDDCLRELLNGIENGAHQITTDDLRRARDALGET